ncbi:MAG: PorP/SprF family type IX secretion system membrane protein [Bacteroidales bacterium]|nr:PorP/SprF family type IX secretion system membrane protein [Bacteroidales bacterium]
MMRKVIWSIVFLLLSTNIFGQQLFGSTQYILRPYELNPAMAGYYGYSEIHLDYRHQWSDISGSPQTININGYGNLYQHQLWLGTNVNVDHSGLISSFNSIFSLSYILHASETGQLFFGLWGNFYQMSVDLRNLPDVDPSDPLLQNKTSLNAKGFSTGFGINYSGNSFDLGFELPNAMSKTQSSENGISYQVENDFLMYYSQMFVSDDLWKIKTMIVWRKIVNEPGNFDISATGIYQDRFWMGMLYRSTGMMSINLGGYLNGGLVVGYSYGVGLGGVNKYGGSIHEISISFRFGMKGNQYFQRANQTNSTRKNYNFGQPQIID